MLRPARHGVAALTAGLAAAWLAACQSPRPPAPPDAPNVILLTLDALRQDHLSFAGYTRETSPNLDWIAERALYFDNVIPSGCSTKASLSSLLTSLDYSRHKLLDRGDGLSDDHVTLAETFYDAGYATAGFSSTPMLTASLNYGQGFETYEDFVDLEVDYVPADVTMPAVLEALRRPDRERERPFFYYIHLEEPHPPWRHGSPWLAAGRGIEQPFGRGCSYIPTPTRLASIDDDARQEIVDSYDGAIHYADAWVGVLLATLRDLDELDNTVIGVTTDHGLELLERYSASHGMNPFDEVVRTFFLLFDGRARLAEPGVRSRQARIFDVGPTLLGRAGVEPPTDVQGVDLLGPEELPAFAFTTCYNGTSVRGEGYKLIELDFQSHRRARRLNEPVGYTEGLMLFDLDADPDERVDVSGDSPDQVRRMTAALAAHKARVDGVEGVPSAVSDEELDPAMLERLRALGYVR